MSCPPIAAYVLGDAALVAPMLLLQLVLQPLRHTPQGGPLGLEGPALLALAVTAALPSAQDIFVHATRYARQPVLARDAIFVTTFLSVATIIVITALLA